MDNKTVKTFVNIIVGIALLTVIYSFCSLIFDAITLRDAIILDPSIIDSDVRDIVNLATWMIVALICLLVPTLVCYGFALFGKNKIMTIASAAMSLFVVVSALAFFFVLRENAFTGTAAYTIATAAFPEFAELIAASMLTCAFFTYESVVIIINIKKTRSENKTAAAEQTEQNLTDTVVITEEENKNEEN
ncbi:MAG: hypothetical protein K2K04_02705 [Clostridia bacterium]|nr:hypothetical protein [Clostridia bacterium]